MNHLSVLYPTFVTYCLSATDSPPNTSEDEPVELPQLLCPIIDFVAAVIRGGKAREWVNEANILSIVSSVFAFVQMIDDDVCKRLILINMRLIHAQVDTWANNANAFVAQEEDETQAYSVRVAGFDLLSVSLLSRPNMIVYSSYPHSH